MYRVLDFDSNVLYRSEDIYDIRDYLDRNFDRDDCDFLDFVDEYINENSSFDIVGLNDYWFSASDILKTVDESSYNDLIEELLEAELDDLIYRLNNYETESRFYDYRIVDSDDEEEANPDLVKIYRSESIDSETHSIYLENIHFNREEADEEVRQLLQEAEPNVTYYLAFGSNNRPCKEEIMRDL